MKYNTPDKLNMLKIKRLESQQKTCLVTELAPHDVTHVKRFTSN